MNTESLTRKVGPLPVWAWAALILALVWFFFLRGSTANASSAPISQDGSAPVAASQGGASDSAAPPPVDVGQQVAQTTAAQAAGGYTDQAPGAVAQSGPAFGASAQSVYGTATDVWGQSTFTGTTPLSYPGTDVWGNPLGPGGTITGPGNASGSGYTAPPAVATPGTVITPGTSKAA